MFLRRLKITVFLLILLGIAGFAGWVWLSLNYVYSTGERAGYIQKFSKKGWVFKTWEGELAMVNLPGAMPEKFLFTVRKKDVASKIESTMGNRIVLRYNEHKYIPTRFFGDTPYFVVEVRSVETAPPPPALPATPTPGNN